jgi:hypothetical protein
MTKPHKFEVNSTYSGSLIHFYFFLDKKWAKSKIEIFFWELFYRGFQKINFKF